MKSSEGSKLHKKYFGAGPKKITCQCNTPETAGEVITIQMNTRCAVCNSLYQITIPESELKMAQPRKEQFSFLTVDPRVLLPVEVNTYAAYRPTDWLTGVLAL